MEAIHRKKGMKDRKEKMSRALSAAASVLRYHVILEDTGKAIIKKHYRNYNFSVPVSILTMLSLTFTDRHK